MCSGIYSKKDWDGPSDSYIDVVLKPENSEEFQDEWIALIIFEYRNVGLIGVDLPGDGNVSSHIEGCCNSRHKLVIDSNI